MESTFKSVLALLKITYTCMCLLIAILYQESISLLCRLENVEKPALFGKRSRLASCVLKRIALVLTFSLATRPSIFQRLAPSMLR